MKDILLTINNQCLSAEELITAADLKTGDENTPHWERAVYAFIRQWLDKSLEIVQYSSGTTGKSKKIVLQKQSMIRSAENTCRFFNLVKGETAVLCLPIEFIAGKMMVVRCITGGLNLQLVEPRSRPEINGIPAVSFCAMVPLQVMNIISAGGMFPPVQNLIIGGAEISRELESRLKDIPVQIFATYGMAETCSHIAVRRINGPDPDAYYQAFPGIELATDERNCLVIKAGYLPETIVTNDEVLLEGNGRFRWIGRYDNLINSGGIKIVPEEVESAMADTTGLECALIGLPDTKLGKRLIFVAEKNKYHNEESKIRSELQKLLPPAVLPKEIMWVDKFPRNRSFKLDRQKLTSMVYAGL
jgi:O-succinylbenzoic acid--CoA ligase